MKKTLICFAAASLVLGFNFQALTSSSTPPAGYTSAPGESNCTSCHSGAANTGLGSVTLTGAPTTYTPGTAYTLQVTVTDASKTKFGFELTALTASNAAAGTYTAGSNTSTQVSGGKTYINHKNASSTNTWTFTWNAPATNVGPVKFYISGNAANGNSNTTGDNIYTATILLAPTTTTGLKEDNNALVSVFPNPATETLHMNFAGKSSAVKVLDMTGREVFQSDQSGVNNQLDVSKYPNGTYFLQMEHEKTTVLKRFVVQH